MPEDDPNQMITELMQAASASHEAFITLIESGFTEQQALYLVGQILTSSTRPDVPGGQ
jgi:phage gp29-like protein